MSSITINNHQRIPVNSIPVTEYQLFLEFNLEMLDLHPERHCVLYFGMHDSNTVRLFCCIADDNHHNIFVSSSVVKYNAVVNSFSVKNLSFERFEREIHENFGIGYTDHPWLKPVRYSENRYNKAETIPDYPFFWYFKRGTS